MRKICLPRFTLKYIFLSTLVTSYLIGWWCSNAYEQRRAVALLRKNGLIVEYERSFFSRPLALILINEDANQLRDYFERVKSVESPSVPFVSMSGTHWMTTVALDADSIRSLSHLRGLTELRLRGVAVTDEALDTIGTIKSLKVLCLNGADVSDEGVGRLRSLHRLKVLDLQGTRISNTAVEHLEYKLSLEKLCLDQTMVTDECFESLRKLPNLKNLSVIDVRSSDGITVAAVDSFSRSNNNCTVMH